MNTVLQARRCFGIVHQVFICFHFTAIVVTSKGIEMKQSLEKAFLANSARRVVPTLAGISLDFQHRTAAVAKVTVAANINVEPSIGRLPQLQALTATTEIKPMYWIQFRCHVTAVLFCDLFFNFWSQFFFAALTPMNKHKSVSTLLSCAWECEWKLLRILTQNIRLMLIMQPVKGTQWLTTCLRNNVISWIYSKCGALRSRERQDIAESEQTIVG